MYIYIYCIYISHKKIQHLPPPRRAARVARALGGGNCSDDRFLGRFQRGEFGTGILLRADSPGSPTSSAGRLLGCVALGKPTSSLRSLPLSFPDFFFSLFFFFSLPSFLRFCFCFFRN